ncbi:hypothetical protein IEQ11_03980 [Lysobacter capsici]|jgi:hypothetical protein|uniref:hypothetical protein n=1 Tax=Lysobacter capsici TaxID=435897 RepID=UPI000627D2BD|nr:hypothetical protein [Lysobacter capsici]ALN84196.1 hypothetical protein LC55x_0899 [Lysobacter capsici]ATE70576.1 hypothetical protein CNO08_03895 [Lysobacter capsici]UOF15833.1 hypothetical protein IEQ11_03980 [Lysobacter capsici]WND81559.1 hypothetical protein RJ610_04045 [Lysobacter capsici]WND86755.1 hypothetical protein RJ609_04045 [Lysobacter capsici]
MHPLGNPAESGQPELHVQHVACVNNAAFVLRFVVQRLDGDRVISQTPAGGAFAAGQTRSVDLSALRFHGHALDVGDRVRIRARAIGGTRRDGPSVAFAPNGHTATFSVRGTTLSFSVNRI